MQAILLINAVRALAVATPRVACSGGLELEDCAAWQDLYDATGGAVGWLRCSEHRNSPCDCTGNALPPLSTENGEGDVPWGVNCEDKRIAGPLLLHRNNMTGTLPDTLGDMIMITKLWLQHNTLTGAIPLTLVKLGNVISLALNDNAFDGYVPALDFTQYTNGCGIGGGKNAYRCPLPNGSSACANNAPEQPTSPVCTTPSPTPAPTPSPTLSPTPSPTTPSPTTPAPTPNATSAPTAAPTAAPSATASSAAFNGRIPGLNLDESVGVYAAAAAALLAALLLALCAVICAKRRRARHDSPAREGEEESLAAPLLATDAAAATVVPIDPIDSIDGGASGSDDGAKANRFAPESPAIMDAVGELQQAASTETAACGGCSFTKVSCVFSIVILPLMSTSTLWCESFSL